MIPIKKITYGATILEVALLLLLLGLEALSGYKAGLAHHLYYKKIYYVTHLYQGLPFYLNCLVMVALTFYTVRACLQPKRKLFFHLYKYLTLFLMLILMNLLPFAHESYIYAHFLMTLQLFLMIETITVFIVIRLDSKK